MKKSMLHGNDSQTYISQIRNPNSSALSFQNFVWYVADIEKKNVIVSL